MCVCVCVCGVCINIYTHTHTHTCNILVARRRNYFIYYYNESNVKDPVNEYSINLFYLH